MATQEENNEKRGKLILNFDPVEVAKFLSEVGVTRVTHGGHELLFGNDE